MSDLKMLCPACDAWTSAVGIAFRDGADCPYCGLPAEAARMVIEAQERNVSEEVLKRLTDAEIRAAKAETEAAELRARLATIRRALDE
jgi:microcystin degradation protein MlrC